MASPQQMDPMPDGPPVGLQRWAFGTGEVGDTAGSGDLRAVSGTSRHRWSMGQGSLRRITLAPQLNLTHNQLTTGVSLGQTVQSMAMIRSRGRSWPYDYVMHWELRRNVGPTMTVLAGEAAHQWVSAGPTPPLPDDSVTRTPLTVWFPSYLTTPPPRAVPDAQEPGAKPAPLGRLLDELPLFGADALPDHDTLFGDVVSAFAEHLGALSDASLDELYQFFGEGNQRGLLSQAWTGTVASPVLYSRSGDVLGYLRLAVRLSGGDTPSGPATSNSVVDTYVMRSLRMQGSSQVAHALGLTLPLRFSMWPSGSDVPSDGEQRGGSVSLQGGVQHHFAHTLVSGGSARIAQSLRTAEPQLHVTAEMTVTVTLMRPSSRPVHPSAGSPLAAGKRYRVGLLVPSLATLGQEPAEPRYVPAEVLHLKQLGVSTTPLQVSGTTTLFDRAERWLRDHGFLPSDRPRPGVWDAVNEQGADAQRLANQRKLDQMRSRHGLRAALNEMVDGGAATAFELPAHLGTRRATVRLTAERRYTGPEDNVGIDHEKALPGVQTLNYVGSTTAGDEQFQTTPLAWNVGFGASVVNPFDLVDDAWFQEFGFRYTYSSQPSRTTGSSAGTGHEYYILSPTSAGSHVFSVPVTYRLEISFSHGGGLPAHTADGSVRLALPAHRTLTTPHTGPRPMPATIRDVLASDAQALGQPSDRHHAQMLRPPDTAIFDRVPGSAELRELIPRMLDEMDQDTVRQEEQASPGRPPMPGSFPEDGDLEMGTVRTVPSHEPAVRPDDSHSRLFSTPTGTSEQPSADAIGGLFDTARWAGRQMSGLGRWLARTAVGEPATNPESAAREVIDTAFSPHHLVGNASRIFGDSYVVESAGTPGLAAGTDIMVEVRGYLTEVKALPAGPPMDLERWLQSVDASASTTTRSSSHQGTFSLNGRYGRSGPVTSPNGDFIMRRSTTDSTTVNDNTGAFRVTTEDTTPVYRFTAKPHLVVRVVRARRNVVSGTVAPHAVVSSSTKVVEPGPLEFLLVDNDLQNHPELARLVRDTGRQPAVENHLDQRLPPWFVETGGTLGFGAVSEVELFRGRDAFTESIRTLVEREAPGATRPGNAAYVPGVLSRINEHATSVGLRALVNAGPRGHTAFHFVHRSWLGPRLVEVALTAHPAGNVALRDLRGKRVTATSGLDNVFGHSNGDGATLGRPGATKVSRSTTDSRELTFSPAVVHHGHGALPVLSTAERTTWTDTQLSSRERRTWQRTFSGTNEFRIPYEYRVTVRSRSLDDALTGRLARAISDTAHALAPIAVSRIRGLLGYQPHASTGIQATEQAEVTLRFNASETTGNSRTLTSGPGLFTSNPAAQPAPPPSPGDAVIDFTIPDDVRTAVTQSGWVPERPFHVYDFAAAEQLGRALRAVDPTLTQDLSPRTTRSAEGIFLRLTTLAATGRLTLLEPAATAPVLGHPGNNGTSVRLTLHAPQVEASSKDTAIDRIELAADGFQTQGDQVTATGVTFAYMSAGPHPVGTSVPIAGERAALGQTALSSSQRRELLRFGTPMVNARGEGMDGYRIRAVALLEVRGPKGTCWVTGDILLRTTEAPPFTATENFDSLPAAEGVTPPTQHGSPSDLADQGVDRASPRPEPDTQPSGGPVENVDPCARQPEATSQTATLTAPSTERDKWQAALASSGAGRSPAPEAVSGTPQHAGDAEAAVLPSSAVDSADDGREDRQQHFSGSY
ncbi:hypothetical protein AQJ11_44935 [Streptomyces corchorusii]|uniref:Uncharacterized protein n=2 Tax=Streptomyces TaxID=1883 RepID=A0A101PKR6_STRCK|nr:hypothetical protein AQJ11_44935 [Streptomyces corchorusii]